MHIFAGSTICNPKSMANQQLSQWTSLTSGPLRSTSCCSPLCGELWAGQWLNISGIPLPFTGIVRPSGRHISKMVQLASSVQNTLALLPPAFFPFDMQFQKNVGDSLVTWSRADRAAEGRGSWGCRMRSRRRPPNPEHRGHSWAAECLPPSIFLSVTSAKIQCSHLKQSHLAPGIKRVQEHHDFSRKLCS